MNRYGYYTPLMPTYREWSSLVSTVVVTEMLWETTILTNGAVIDQSGKVVSAAFVGNTVLISSARSAVAAVETELRST